MIPKTPQEMRAILINVLVLRLYGDITKAAVSKRLTEQDIRKIEQATLDLIRNEANFASEFKTFEVEPEIAGAIATVREMCEATRSARLAKKG
jgi:hypothetical protein